MSTSTVKLTLTVPEAILKTAKAFSKRHKKSISRMVSEYLSHLTEPPVASQSSPSTPSSVDPLVLKLTGVAELPPKYRKMDDKELLSALREERLLGS